MSLLPARPYRRLGCLTADEISVELVASITADLKVALNLVIAQITALKGVSLEKVLCNTAGGVLGAADIAALLVSVLTVSASNRLPWEFLLMSFTARPQRLCLSCCSRCCLPQGRCLCPPR